ncbi:MAG: YgjP-like metallopeptidase domain-containing protein [Thermodesulfobacteriota bacterium]
MELPNIPYSVSHRNVKYPRLEFRTGELLLILPPGLKPNPILKKHKEWIIKKMGLIEECLKQGSEKKPVERTEREFRELTFSLVNKALKELDGRLNRIYFRRMRTKWASLSSKRNLTVNRLMRNLPEHLLNYVIFHEILHLKERRHNDRFLERISKRFYNYQAFEMDLFVYWFQIANKIRLDRNF